MGKPPGRRRRNYVELSLDLRRSWFCHQIAVAPSLPSHSRHCGPRTTAEQAHLKGRDLGGRAGHTFTRGFLRQSTVFLSVDLLQTGPVILTPGSMDEAYDLVSKIVLVDGEMRTTFLRPVLSCKILSCILGVLPLGNYFLLFCGAESFA